MRKSLRLLFAAAKASASVPEEEGPEVTPITWDSGNMGPDIVLSGSDRVATVTLGAESWQAVRSVQALTTPGLYVYEIGFAQISGTPETGWPEVGVVTASADLTVANVSLAETAFKESVTTAAPSSIAFAFQVIGDGSFLYWRDVGAGWIGENDNPGDPGAGLAGNPKQGTLSGDLHVLCFFYTDAAGSFSGTIKALEDFTCTIPSGATVLAAA